MLHSLQRLLTAGALWILYSTLLAVLVAITAPLMLVGAVYDVVTAPPTA